VLLGKTKILVCGSGPSLPGQLKNIDLSSFFVVRVNSWGKIDGADNRCDAWAFYPVGNYFEKYIDLAGSVWMPHFGFGGECERLTGIKPTYTITRQQTKDFHILIGNPHPTSGAVVIYMAMMLDAKIFIAGFDFYQGNKKYYYNGNNDPKIGLEHYPEIEQSWVNDQIKKQKLFNFGAK